MQNKPTKTNLAFMAIIALTALVALALQFYITVINAQAGGVLSNIVFYFSFFTILTNLVVATSFTTRLLVKSTRLAIFFARPSIITATTLYILVVGIVYNLILRNLWQPQGLQLLADELLHVAVPALCFLYWLIFVPKQGLQWKSSFMWLLYPAIYFVYILIRGEITREYPYPFMDVTTIGYQQMLINAGFILIAFLIIGLLFIAAGKMKEKHP